LGEGKWKKRKGLPPKTRLTPEAGGKEDEKSFRLEVRGEGETLEKIKRDGQREGEKEHPKKGKIMLKGDSKRDREA